MILRRGRDRARQGEFKGYGPRPKARQREQRLSDGGRSRPGPEPDAARGPVRPRRRRRRHQRRRHRARRGRPRADACCCARRTTSPRAPRRARGKLVHGGLRYLEYYEFRLVREALIEREVLLRGGAAHHLADALRAAARPSSGRPGWSGSACSSTTIWAAARSCRRRRGAGPAPRPGGRAAAPEYTPRLRIFRLLGRRRAAGGAERARRRRARRRSSCTRTACVARPARRRPVAVDAAGRSDRRAAPTVRPGARQCGRAVGRAGARPGRGRQSSRRVRLVKGSHIVVPKFWDGPQAYLLQNTDKR